MKTLFFKNIYWLLTTFRFLNIFFLVNLQKILKNKTQKNYNINKNKKTQNFKVFCENKKILNPFFFTLKRAKKTINKLN